MKVSDCVVLVIFTGLVACHAQTESENSTTGVEKCSEVKGIENLVECVAMSTLDKLQDLSVKENIQILPGIVLSSDVSKADKELRQKRTMALPTNPEEKISKMFNLLFSVMNNLFSGRTLKIKMTEQTSNSVMRAFEEGRGKMKKLTGPLMMALGAKMVAIIPILLGGLALFVSKALIVSKVAFVLAIIVGLQYLFSSGGSGFFNRFGQNWNNYNTGGYNGGGYNYIAYGVPNAGSNFNTATSQGYPYARSMDNAQDLAYAAQK